jgi:lipoprotein signal peptidase
VTERLQIRILAVLLAATAFAAVDQWVKLFVATPAWAYHHRSAGWFLGSCLLFVAMTALSMLPSLGVAVGAALFAGGLLGNMMSATSDHFDVPNPLLIGHRSGVAFNVADVCIVVGNLVLMVACCGLAIRNRKRLDAWAAASRTRVRNFF